MKVVLIQPYYENIWESLGLGYIISYCKANYLGDITFEFFQGNFDTDEHILEQAKDADIVGFSCTSPCFAHALKLARNLKRKNPRVHTVFGGWHVTALKEKALEECIDQIVVGEGERAFLEVLNGNRNKILYGQAIPMQDLPWPDRDAIKNERTIELCEEMVGKRITSFQANRVCPVSCVFCAEQVMTGKFNRLTNPIRQRDIKDVCDEIAHQASKYGLTYFKFVDATFDTSSDYVIKFCKEKIARNINLEWECLIHATFVTEEMFYWLRKSNCKQINIGCESGSPKILSQIGKGTRVEVIERAFKLAKDYDIERRAFFILGMPEETEEDLQLTEQMIDRIKPDVIGFTILCPYPGAKLYDHDKYGKVDWENTDEYSNDFWQGNYLTNQELKTWQAYFTKKYKYGLCERQENTT